MDYEINAGYKIIEKLSVGESVYALGQLETGHGTQYVTWCARADDPTNYFWGYYTDNYPDAKQNLLERMLEVAKSINPNHQKRMAEKLPHFCMSTLPSDGHLIKITHKENRYSYSDLTTDDPAENKNLARYLNDLLDVSPAQESAMLAGSMFGWNVPAANPANYDADGKPIKPKQREMER